MWFLVLFLVAVVAGCASNPGETVGTAGPVGTTRPTVKSTVPATTTPIQTVLPDTAISVTFSKDMASGTITAAGAFTVTGPGSALVQGTATPVTYDVASRTATFHPAAALAPGTYIATIKGTGPSAVTDSATPANALAGNPALPLEANDYVWSFTTSLTAPALRPTVTSSVPAKTAPIQVVLPGTLITATFNKVMDATTITAPGAFTVAGVTGAVPAVTYDIASKTATFHPAAPLTVGVTYTATIKGTGPNPVTDSSGNALAGISVSSTVANDYVWSFTTAAVAGPPPLTIKSFGIAATAGVRNTGISTINGNAVLDPVAGATCNGVQIDAVGGFGLCGGSPPIITGQVISPLFPDAGITSAKIKADLLAEFLSITPPSGPPAAGSLGGAINLPAGTTLGAVTGSALVPGVNLFTPGVYQSLTSILITGDITLDAQLNPNATFVFQSSSTVGTADGAASPGVHTRIILKNGAKASNVSWQAGTSATLGTNSEFYGNILASADITMKTGATSCGRLLAGAFTSGAFVFDTNIVSVPGNVNAPGCL